MTKNQLLSLLAAHPSKLEAATAIRLVGEVWPTPVLITPEQAISYACRSTGAPRSMFAAKTRKREIIRARGLFVKYMIENYTRTGLKKIAQYMGKNDHSNAIHTKKTITNLIDIEDPQTMTDLENFESLVGGGDIIHDYQLSPDKIVIPTASKPVRNNETGQVFFSMTAAAKHEKIPVATFTQSFRERKRKFNYSLVDRKELFQK